MGIAHSVMGKTISDTGGTSRDEVHLRPQLRRKGHIGFVLCSVKLGRKPNFRISEEQSVVIKLILYD